MISLKDQIWWQVNNELRDIVFRLQVYNQVNRQVRVQVYDTAQSQIYLQVKKDIS